MSSKDRSDQTGVSRRADGRTGASQTPANDNTQWDIDPAEIDRYLSGRPQRPSTSESPRSRVSARTTPTASSTVDQLSQLRQRVSQDARPSPRASARAANEPTAPSPRRSLKWNSLAGNAADATTDAASDPVQAEPTRPVRNRNVASTPVSSRIRPTEYRDVEPYYDDVEDSYDSYEEVGEETAPARRGRAITPPSFSMPSIPKITVPARVSEAAIFGDIVSLSLIGASVLGLAVMSILVANRIDTLPTIIPTHVSASGVQEHLKTRGAIWGLPLLGVFLSLMNIAIATFTAKLDRFASRFILAAGLVVQFVAWVATIRILW